jgi:hypothetical protein
MARNPLWSADAAANIGSSRILHLWCRACADRPSNGYKTSGSVWPRQRAFASIARFNRSRQMAAAGSCDPLTARCCMTAIAHSGRLVSTYCGRSRPRPWTPQLGGERAYKDRLGKDWSPRQSRHSVRGWRSIRASCPHPWRGIGAGAGGGCGVGCLAMSGICYATADETNKSG